MQVFLDPLFAAHPDVKVVQFGYTVLGYGNIRDEFLPCNLLAPAMYTSCVDGFNGVNKTCANEEFLSLQLAVEQLSVIYPDNHVSVNIAGALQVAGGVESARIDSPNMGEFSPSEFFRGGGCIHANDAGYTDDTGAL